MCGCRLVRFDDKDPSVQSATDSFTLPGKEKGTKERSRAFRKLWRACSSIGFPSKSTTGPKLGSGESGNTIMAA